MARTGPTSTARRTLLWLAAIIIACTLAVGGGVLAGAASWSPKLGLDLEGGTQMILAPKVEGAGSITSEQLDQAVSIIRQRVDGSGVSEAQISTEGGNNVVVNMPGKPTDAERELIKASANMNFRPVIVATQVPSGAVPEAEQTPADKLPVPTAAPVNASDPNWVDAALMKQFEATSCIAPLTDRPTSSDPAKPLVSCEPDSGIKYILGPVEIPGKWIKTASYGLQAGAQGATTNEWSVQLTLTKPEGAQAFKEVTQRLNSKYLANPEDPQSRFAIVLDDSVISAPASMAVITDGQSSITGQFTEESAKSLSDKLKFGSLPISFEIQSELQISATLGLQQLEMGMLAGLIGLGLVVIYSLFQYRALGLVTISSLVIAGVITYLAIILLGWAENYRLSLAGVAGIIVAIGQTADSFIVYFERVRDELRDGRGLVAAVENGWARAKRTILASKAVNLLAALVLYFVSVGNVKGFAFTLGLTAVADLIVVFMFTHPTLQLLARTKFFGEGHRFSGLDPVQLGAIPLYRGAGRLRTPEETMEVVKGKNARAAGEAERRQTIAERRLAAKEAELVGSRGAGAAKSESNEDSKENK
ncbi:protein translocase subunit SecD [Arthrobacter glacialis]|uniref:Protein translocase subunit SecD n=1 Tax=Arthrobacter glacialis TaxID=1664 RepID=A0A2S3ZWX4_ARTGL|nr:protein translocase subunit SecD [Arthrobacter glacialis]POH58805.1 protein translocase subunit SecD [Arthrobacter glacialis]POH73673.1 protein translocase subunit SecD [Arthrobacter glacialis]